MKVSKFLSIKSLCLGLDHLYKIRQDQLTFFQKILHKGKTVKLTIGPYRYWVLFDPIHIESALKTNAASTVRFKRVINILAKWNGNSLLMAEGEQWQSQRRAILPALKTSNIQQHCETISTISCQWVQKKLALSNSIIELDVDKEMAELTLIIAAKTMFGYDVSQYAPNIVNAVSILSDAAFNEAASLTPLPDWLPIKSKRDKSRAIATMQQLVDNIIAEKFSLPIAQQPDMVRVLSEKYGNDTRHIHHEIMTLLIAGHETTGAAMSWVFFSLVNNPDALKTLQQELKAWPDDIHTIFSHLKKSPYLEVVVKEVMRLYPPAYTLFVRQATQDFLMHDIEVKRGDLLHILPYVLHRTPEWFSQPEKFIPERFLSEEPSWPPYSYLPFGGGARICLGQQFGMVELTIMTAIILRYMSPHALAGEVHLEAKSSLRPRNGLKMLWRKYQG
jgi:cytochrome P450